MSAPLTDYAITHSQLRPTLHPRLGVTVDGRSAVRYLRFLGPVKLDRLELRPAVYGRATPAVPTHPAHLILSVLDRGSLRWRTIREVDLPPNPLTSGKGLSQRMSAEAMDKHFAKAAEAPPHVIPLRGLRTEHLRVECDREHPAWPNHGECNGGPLNVPFGILDPLRAIGRRLGAPRRPDYLAPLKAQGLRPRAPRGMAVHIEGSLIRFTGRRLSVAFSLLRPIMLELGWDAGGDRQRAGRNRLKRGPIMGLGVLATPMSGPVLRTFDRDVGPEHWTGAVSVEGNRLRYHGLTCGLGVTLDLCFTIEAQGITAELTQRGVARRPALEAEAWRLAWNVGSSMTGAAAEPTRRPGRTGEVTLPMMWASDGVGCLRCELLESTHRDVGIQVESYRWQSCVTGGIVMGPRADSDHCLAVPRGERRAVVRWTVDDLQPRRVRGGPAPSEGVRRHWASLYSCFRPEHGGFSNNAVSTHCHVNQHVAAEVVVCTRRPAQGPDPLELYRFTITRSLKDGGGYGYWRNLYMDTDPVVLCGAGRLWQAREEVRWLREVEPGLREAVARVLSTIGKEGLAICRDLSGNRGSHRWSCNSLDIVGFGHMDAYANAWTYRGLRNAAAMLSALGDGALSRRCRDVAAGLRAAYAKHLVNPRTGWVAGWRSRDGKLHDPGHLWVNGPALAFGLLDDRPARRALLGLEDLRRRVGPPDARLGLPFNLLPLDAGDHMAPRLLWPTVPTFECFIDGGVTPPVAMYYLRALSRYGLRRQADTLARDLSAGLDADYFSGGLGSGVEFYRWDGVPCGYEGSFCASFPVVYAIAVQEGVIEPPQPEWWPAEG